LKERNVRASRLIPAILFAALLSGCASYGPRDPRVDATNDLETMQKVLNLAVLPVRNGANTPEAERYLVDFDQALGSEMILHQRYRITFPWEVEKAAKKHNIDISKATGAELVALGRLMKVDGLLETQIMDFKPYYPPRIALRMKVYATRIRLTSDAAPIEAQGSTGFYAPKAQEAGQVAAASAAPAQKTGAPRDWKPIYREPSGLGQLSPADLAPAGIAADSNEVIRLSETGIDQGVGARGFADYVWQREDMFDCRDAETISRMRSFASWAHDSDVTPLGDDIFLRNMSKFFEFASHIMATDMVKDSKPPLKPGTATEFSRPAHHPELSESGSPQ